MFFAAVVEISYVGDEDDVLILAFDDILIKKARTSSHSESDSVRNPSGCWQANS
jgi:hypothetical protein